jgi:predicted small lipoprotein YifL
VASLLLALALLGGCGFKGDLVHPEADDATQHDKAEPAERDPVPE